MTCNEQSEQINELAAALCKCQMELQPAIKDSNNPFFKSKYADLSAVQAACREPLGKNGLCVIQTINRSAEGDPVLTTTLAHLSGQWIKSTCPIPIKEEVGKVDPNKKMYKNDPQALGSSITYMRRYALSAIVGVSTEDDDGEAAMNRQAESQAKIKREKEEVKKSEPAITADQVKQLKDLKEKCDPNYIATVLNHMKSLGCDGFESVSVAMYPRVLKGMTENASIYKKGK